MLMLAALLFELLLGWPEWLFSRIRHPVVWIGSLIDMLERRFNDENSNCNRRYLAGLSTSVLVVLVSGGSALLLVSMLPDNLVGSLAQALVGSSLLAARSLHEHVEAVVTPLSAENLSKARTAVSMIVGRETRELDGSGVSAAALESLAENASDGVVAPLFWGLVLGLPGLVAYKAINTLDSMIGHRTARYEDYGRFAARLDDAVNWLPARMTALLFWSVGGCRGTFRQIVQQASCHRSPNAGWPESAMAFALDVRLSGPRVYGSVISNEPWLNPGGKAPNVQSLQRGLALYVQAVAMCAVLLLVLAVFFNLVLSASGT